MPDNLPIDEVTCRSAELAGILKALANEKRLKALCYLMSGEKCAKDIAAHIEAKQSSTSQHLAWVKKQHLVNTRQDGQTTYYSLTDRTRKLLNHLLPLVGD